MSESSPVSDAGLIAGLTQASVLLAAVSVLVWLAVFGVRLMRLRRSRSAVAAEEELTGIVLDQLSGYGAAAVKLNLLPDWKRDILLQVLQQLIEQTKGRDQANLIRILHDAGFHQAALQQLREHRDPAVRQSACTVLGYFSDEPSVQTLRAALEDADPAVRLTAARALLHKDRVDSLATLLRQLRFPPDDPPLVLAEIFARLPDRLRPEAISLLGSRQLPPEWLRMLALALARNQVFDAFDAIASLRNAPQARVRSAAWVALAELGDPRAGDLVLEGLRDPASDVRQVAGQCAGKLGGPEVLPVLGELARHGDWWGRFHAASALHGCGPEGRALLARLAEGAPPEDPVRQVWNEHRRGGGGDGR